MKAEGLIVGRFGYDVDRAAGVALMEALVEAGEPAGWRLKGMLMLASQVDGGREEARRLLTQAAAAGDERAAAALQAAGWPVPELPAADDLSL